jgi:hypothetical protein
MRDISLVSEEEYARLAPPCALASFPGDLLHPDLEYSGIYENGWVAELAHCTLTHRGGSRLLVVRGQVPMLAGNRNFAQELTVLVDGRPVARRHLGLGDFEVRTEVTGPPGRQRVELHFAHCQHLPAPDNRPVAALLTWVGFEKERRGGPTK